MKTFAFLTHPTNIAQLKNFRPISRIIPIPILNKFFKDNSTLRVFPIKEVQSSQKKEIEGHFITLSLLPKQLLDLGENLLLNKIVEAAEIAERLNAQILGLGELSAAIGEKVYQIKKKLNIPLTTGATLSAWSVFEAIYKVAKIKNLNLKESHLAIIGATGAVGSLSTKKLSNYVSRITLNSLDDYGLKHLAGEIHQWGTPQINISVSLLEAIKDADIVVFAEDLLSLNLSSEEFKSKAIIFDLSLDKQIALELKSHPDITVIEAGWIKMPYPAKFSLNTGLPNNIVSASLAETILLTLEEKFCDYSLGENINPDKLDEIADIAARHGFEVYLKPF